MKGRATEAPVSLARSSADPRGVWSAAAVAIACLSGGEPMR